MAVRERQADYGRITDEGIEKYRMRIGIRQAAVPAWYREATPDALRHFAWSFGDDNPLFCEPAYGATTRWGSMIASPFFAKQLAEPVAPEIPKEQREKSRGALAGVHQFHAGTEIHFFRPIVPGDRAFTARWVTAVEEKESRFGGGRSVVTDETEYYETAEGQPLAQQRDWLIHTDRAAAKDAGVEKTVPVPHYSPEEIEEIHEHLVDEKPWGAERRYWEDVQVGDKLDTLLKGPMTITDIVASHIGRGPGHYAFGPLRIAAQRRAKIPGFYVPNEFGAMDVVQRVHWDAEYARQIGAARVYDYGSQRINWLGHVVTDWMGDDAWLVRLRCEIRKFNYIGDLSRISGEVTATNQGDHTVEVKLACVNQRDEDTCPGDATIALPSRAAGLPELPAPPRDWPQIQL